MLSVKIQQFPNREIRIRCAPVNFGRGLLFESQGETKPPIGSPSPNLTLVPNSKPSRSTQKSIMKAGYGGRAKATKFGTYAKRTLLRVGGVIDQIDSNPGNGVFLTGTLPGSTHKAMQAIADWSGYIVHRLKAWIAKYVPEKLDFYVWERQKRGALHLHYYCYCSDECSRNYILKQFRDWWINILKSVSDRSGVDLFAKSASYSHRRNLNSVQAYAQTVEKSVAAYLAKYCSKQSSQQSLKQSSKQSSQYYPSRWWGASRPLLKRLREMTHTSESLYANVYKARRKYEELISHVERYSTKGYRYADKVGLGLNHVYYFATGDAEKCYKEVQQTMDTLNNLSMMSTEDAIAELRRMIVWMQQNRQPFERLLKELSEQSRNATSNLLGFQPVAPMDAWALATEINALTGYLLKVSSLTPQSWTRVECRSRIIGVVLQNRIAIETMVNLQPS